MTRKEISDIASAISARECVLFAGAGLTADTGGASWSGLIDFLKEHYSYISPLKDGFQIMGDMCLKYGKQDVYSSIKRRLENAVIKDDKIKLTNLSWRVVFTTNYDLALEEPLDKNQKLTVRRVVTGKEFGLDGIQSELLYVKLMGSLDIPHSQPGSMVLTKGDYTTAIDERSRIFDILQSYAARLSFLFIGYSFKDGLFIEILEKLVANLGISENTYYALFRSEPDEETLYILNQYKVKIIIDELNNFVNDLSYQVSLRDPTDYRIKRIPIGNDLIPIDSTKLREFLSKHYPIFFEKLNEYVSPYDFLHGKTSSLGPFKNNWYFKRREIEAILINILRFNFDKSGACIICVEGNPGTGRTFAILAAVIDLIMTHRSLAIEIPNYSLIRIPSSEDFNHFISEVIIASQELDIERFERVVFWAEYPLNEADIADVCV
jgi:hypothetical protein